MNICQYEMNSNNYSDCFASDSGAKNPGAGKTGLEITCNYYRSLHYGMIFESYGIKYML
jgi:hypothetical protein